MAAELERIRDSIDSIRANFESWSKSNASNNAAILQRLTANEGWQSAHERLDDERWRALDEKLSNLKQLIEAIPFEVGKDLGNLEKRVADTEDIVATHSETLNTLKGIWVAVSVGAAAIFALVEFFAHKG